MVGFCSKVDVWPCSSAFYSASTSTTPLLLSFSWGDSFNSVTTIDFEEAISRGELTSLGPCKVDLGEKTEVCFDSKSTDLVLSIFFVVVLTPLGERTFGGEPSLAVVSGVNSGLTNTDFWPRPRILLLSVYCLAIVVFMASIWDARVILPRLTRFSPSSLGNSTCFISFRVLCESIF